MFSWAIDAHAVNQLDGVSERHPASGAAICPMLSAGSEVPGPINTGLRSETEHSTHNSGLSDELSPTYSRLSEEGGGLVEDNECAPPLQKDVSHQVLLQA